MCDEKRCIAPAMGRTRDAIGEISWTAIFQELIKQGFSTFAADREATRRYNLALAEAQKEAAGGGSTSGDDKTLMYALIGGAALLAFYFSSK